MNINSQAELIEKILIIRQTEEKLLEAFSQGLIRGTVHTCIGQELSAIAVGDNLNANIDWIFSTHRGHGHFLSFNGQPGELFCELLGASDGPSSGNGGSQHINKGHFFTSGVQGGFIPIALGVAETLAEDVNQGISVIYLGDGTLGQGVLWESLNLSQIMKCPILFVCEDNGIAQTTKTEFTFAGDLAIRIQGFDINYLQCNTSNIDHLRSTVAKAVSHVRDNRQPGFLHIKTSRLMPHSKGDDNRSLEEINTLWRKDYVEEWETLNSNKYKEILTRVQDQINEEFSIALKKVPQNLKLSEQPTKKVSTLIKPTTNMRDSLYESLKICFENDVNTKMFGEDIEYISKGTVKPYGGAFKISKNLSELFPKRILNTPISEAGIVGMGIGRALLNKPTIIEIMFGDFVTLAFDQILQNLSKMPSMYGHELPIPIIIRLPMGGGYGYGATHSQSLEKHFFGLPNITIVAPCPFIDQRNIFGNLLRKQNPVLLIENKRDYQTPNPYPLSQGFAIETNNTEVVLYEKNNRSFNNLFFCYGGTSILASEIQFELMERYNFYITVVIFQQISPLVLNDQFRNPATVVTLEEGIPISGFGSEIISELSVQSISSFRSIKIGGKGIIGTSLQHEKETLPSFARILSELIEFYGLEL
jgi:2-oxoisovalerate dehydrogenase E1 component